MADSQKKYASGISFPFRLTFSALARRPLATAVSAWGRFLPSDSKGITKTQHQRKKLKTRGRFKLQCWHLLSFDLLPQRAIGMHRGGAARGTALLTCRGAHGPKGEPSGKKEDRDTQYKRLEEFDTVKYAKKK